MSETNRLEVMCRETDCKVGDRLQTIVDEAFGPFETLPVERLLTLLERELAEQRIQLVDLRAAAELYVDDPRPKTEKALRVVLAKVTP